MKERSSKDWLEEFHEGQRLYRSAVSDLKGIARHLAYAFPHISDDITLNINVLEESINIINSSINNNIDEQLQNHNKFVGSMFTSLLKGIK